MRDLYLDKKRDLTKLKSQSITLFPSKKMSSTVLTNCPLEANFCYYLEFDDAIERYESQPLGFYYQLDNIQCSFTPDFECFCGHRSVYYEIQSKAQAKKTIEFKRHFDSAQNQAIKLGKDLILVKEDWIKRSPHFQNLMQLYRCMQVQYSYDFLNRIKTKLKKDKVLTIGELIDEHIELPCIYKLIAEKILIFELSSTSLCLGSKVFWRKND